MSTAHTGDATTRARSNLDPDGRMVLLLLVATDPFGVMDDGVPADVYRNTAHEVLAELRTGTGQLDDVITMLTAGGYRVEQVAAFARAALAWWTTDAPKRRAARSRALL